MITPLSLQVSVPVSRVQGGDDCSGAVLQTRSLSTQAMAESDASRSKAHNRIRGQARKQRDSNRGQTGMVGYR
jgi:hypothetical protein